MNQHLKRMAPVFFAALLVFASCKDSKTTPEEQAKITTMDSTSQKAKETTAKLDEQTDKVEASLEKLDAEFETAK